MSSRCLHCAAEMVLDTGSLILAHYTAKVKDTGEIIESTLEEEAKKLGVHDPSRKYEPKLISVGEGWVLRGLDEVLQSRNVGDKTEVEIPPEKAFGERDPNKIKLLPLRKFGEKAGELGIGEMVEIDNRIGIIRSIGSGRAQVDFNHRLAGKTLVYNIEIIRQLENENEKVTWLIRRRLPIDEEKLSFTIDGETVRIRLHSDYYFVEGIQITKKAISSDISRFLKSVSKVVFIEEYEAPKPKDEAKVEERTEEDAQPSPSK